MTDNKILPPYSCLAGIAHQRLQCSHQNQCHAFLACLYHVVSQCKHSGTPTTSTPAPLHDTTPLSTMNTSARSPATRLLTLPKGHHLLAAGSATFGIRRGSSCPRGRADVFRLAFLATWCTALSMSSFIICTCRLLEMKRRRPQAQGGLRAAGQPRMPSLL